MKIPIYATLFAFALAAILLIATFQPLDIQTDTQITLAPAEKGCAVCQQFYTYQCPDGYLIGWANPTASKAYMVNMCNYTGHGQ